MVANVSDKSSKRYTPERIKVLLTAQLENSIDLGWQPEDIMLFTNFDFEFMGVVAQQIEFPNQCLTGGKTFTAQHLFSQGKTKDVLWFHDLDAWQNIWFDCPDAKDIGLCYYSNWKTYNGGSIFYKRGALPAIDAVAEEILRDKHNREEDVLNRVYKSEQFSKLVTILNPTYNVGCSGYPKRYAASDKPIKVAHFHPYNPIAWETHALDRNKLGAKGISDRLETLLRKYYDLAIELRNK